MEPVGPARRPALRALWPRPAVGIFTTLRVTGGLAGRTRLSTWTGWPPARARCSARTCRPSWPTRISKCLAGGGSGRLRITIRPVGGPLHCQVELTEPGPDVAAVRLRVTELPGGLGGHKWADRRLLSQLARAGLAADEQLLLTDADGSVLETDRANVFARGRRRLRTPAADGRILPA